MPTRNISHSAPSLHDMSPIRVGVVVNSKHQARPDTEAMIYKFLFTLCDSLSDEMQLPRRAQMKEALNHVGLMVNLLDAEALCVEANL